MLLIFVWAVAGQGRAGRGGGWLPACGQVSSRMPALGRAAVRDIPHAGQVVVVCKPRLVCRAGLWSANHHRDRAAAGPGAVYDPAEGGAAGRGDRLGQAVGVAADLGVAWWTVQATVNAAAVLLPEVDNLHVRRLGIDIDQAGRHSQLRIARKAERRGAWL